MDEVQKIWLSEPVSQSRRMNEERIWGLHHHRHHRRQQQHRHHQHHDDDDHHCVNHHHSSHDCLSRLIL